jgi:hypothetical protein
MCTYLSIKFFIADRYDCILHGKSSSTLSHRIWSICISIEQLLEGSPLQIILLLPLEMPVAVECRNIG